jgi:hypothetical protein
MDETFRFTKFRNFGLVGTNGATIVPPNYWNRKDDDVWLFRLGTESRPGRDLRVQNLTVDQTAPDTGMRVVNGVVTDGLEVRDIDIRGRHDSGLPGPGLFAVRDPDGEGVVERFRHPAGADFRENTPTGDSGWWFEPTGIYANGNRGTLRFKDCALGGFPDTGLYASWGSGKIVVEGGTYVNSETACLRIGGTRSVVTDATVGVDDVNYENDSQRGIRLENASDVRVAETSVEITDPNGSAILVRSNTDGTVIKDCTVSVSTDRSATGIRVSGRAGETSVLRTDGEFDAAGGYALWMADGGRSDHDTVECTYVSITGDAATDGGRFAIINGRDNTEFRATEVRQSSRDRFRTALRNTGDDVLIYRGRYVSRNNPIIDFGSGTWVESTYAKARSGEPSYLLQADSEDVLIKKSTIVNGIDDRGCDGLRTWANDFDG